MTKKKGQENAPVVVVICGGGKLDLDAVDAVDAVDEEDKDEYKRDFHPVLYLGDDRVFGKEAAERNGVSGSLMQKTDADF